MAAAPQPAVAKPRRSRWLSVGVPIVCSVMAFGLGAASGASGSSDQRTQLVASERSLQAQLRDADSAVSEAQETADEAESAVADAREDLQGSAKRVAQLESQLAERTAQSTTLAQERDALTTQVADLQAAAQTPAPVQFVDTPPQAEPPQPASVYYQNCTAARQAGVTPLYQGSPGYASHLDRDGDGIACE